jgi:hypothetical protein
MVDNSSIVPITSANAPRYHYYTVDILTNKVIGEIPFEDVTYERSLKQPGAFEGKITISDQTNALDLYNATLPGKTAIYVVRDKTAVWGGIIWGRTYDLVGRSLAITANEFTSYLSHRLIWKAYTNNYTADLFKDTKTSAVLVSIKNAFLKAPLTVTDDFGNPSKVSITFAASKFRKYTGSYRVLSRSTTPAAPEDPKLSEFYIEMPTLPAPTSGVYNNVGVGVRTDTYHYLRDLLDNVFNDFINLDFPNEVIEPGITKEIALSTKQLTISNSTYGVATIGCAEPHGLVIGQRIELANVDRMLDGVHTITETPTDSIVRFVVNNPVDIRDRSTPIFLDNTLATAQNTDSTIQRTSVYMRETTQFLRENVTHIQRIAGEVTLTLASAHRFELPQKIKIVMADKKPVMMNVYDNDKKKNVLKNTTKYTGNIALNLTAVTENTISYMDPLYTDTKYNIALTRLSPTDFGKNYVTSSDPRTLLRLYSRDSHGFNLNDRVTVSGVDELDWEYPRYDGNHRIFEVDGGVPHVIEKFEIVADNTYGTVVKFYVRQTNSLGVLVSVGADTGDNFLVNGFTGNLEYLNTTYTAVSPAVAVSGSPAYWVISADGPSNVTALTTLTDKPTLTVNGTKWIEYIPPQSELRNSLSKEPGSVVAIKNLKYTPPKGTARNVVTITTTTDHKFSEGDYVRIEVAPSGTNSKDQETYGGNFVITKINSPDSFSYSLATSKNGKAVTLPTAAINQEKQGSATRYRANLEKRRGKLQTARIIGVATIRNGENNKAYVYSPDHGLVVGDVIKVVFDNGRVSNVANEGEEITITEVPNENTFCYETDGQVSRNKQYPVVGVEFNRSTYLYNTYTAGLPPEQQDANTAVQGSIYYQLRGHSTLINQPERTLNVTRLTAGGYNIYGSTAQLTTVTCSQDLTNLIRPGVGSAGAGTSKELELQVVFRNFPAAVTELQGQAPLHPVIRQMDYNAGARGVLVTCPSGHGLLQSDIGAPFFIDSGPTTLSYPQNTDRVGGLNFSQFVGKRFTVAQVLSATQFAFYFAAGTTNFTAKNLDNLSGTVTPIPTTPTLIGLSYANNRLTLSFAGSHNLDPNLDVNGGTISISGFASTVAGANNSTGQTLDTSFLNNTWSIVSVPSATSVVVNCPVGRPSFSVFNIGTAGTSSTTTFTVRASSISFNGSDGTLAISLATALPFTPTANTAVNIDSIFSTALYPWDTGRVGGVSSAPLSTGSQSLIVNQSSSTLLTVQQGLNDYNYSWTVWGSAAGGTQITAIKTNPSSGGVPTPSIVAQGAVVGNAPLVTSAYPNPRLVEISPDMTKYNGKGIVIASVSGNTFTFIDTISSPGIDVNLSSVSPTPIAFVPAQTWVDVSNGAPLISTTERFSVVGLQDDYAFLNDFYMPVLDYWPGPFVGDPVTPTGYIRVKNNYINSQRPTMPPNKTSGMPNTAYAFSSTTIPGTAYVVPPGVGDDIAPITRVSRSSDGKVATITSPGHGFAVGEEVYVEIFSLEYNAFSQNYQRIKIKSVTEDTFSYDLSTNTRVSSFSGTASITDFGMPGYNELKFAGTGAHNFMTGDTVIVTGVSAFANGTGIYVESTTPGSISYSTNEDSTFTDRSLTTGKVVISSFAAIDEEVSGYVIPTPTVTREPKLLYRTYGEFPSNASIGGMTFSTTEYSNKPSETSAIYGSQLLSVAEILDKYSNSIDGFDYRIDVGLETNPDGTKKFTRNFVILPIYPPSLTDYIESLPGKKLAKNQVAHPKAFGADRLVFEYPGNISNVSLAENANSSATRIFVTGSNSKAGSGSEVPYSAASDVQLLADGWPLLDKKESKEWPVTTPQTAGVDAIDNYDDETGFHQYAQRFLAESRPPVGDLVISVNGSLNPVIGSYNPGDWCSIVINDNFVKTRLNSVLEPRKNVIVRKIDSVRVSVPNNPAFPEQIDLQLVTDWQVDKVGE